MLVKCKRTRDKESGTIRLEMYRVISCKSFSYLSLFSPPPFLSSNKLSLNFIFQRIPTKENQQQFFPPIIYTGRIFSCFFTEREKPDSRDTQISKFVAINNNNSYSR